MPKKYKKAKDGEYEQFSPARKKSKIDDGGRICILHVPGFENEDFIPLSQVKGSATEKLVHLHAIRDKRLQEPLDSVCRMEEVCDLIPESLAEVNLAVTGYHLACYKHFTRNQERLKKKPTVTPPKSSTSRSPRKRLTSSTPQLFPPECIFCRKLEVKVLGKTQRCIKFPVYKSKEGIMKEPTWKKIESQALELGLHRLHRMVQGEDLFAREANYHQSCRKSFDLNYANHKRLTSRGEALHTSPVHGETTGETPIAIAHQMAFNAVLDVIQDEVIGQKKIVQLSSLRLVYTQELERNGFPNPEYRGEKLKSKLEKHEEIAFAKVTHDDKGCITYNLVYNASLSVSDAVAHAYQLGSKDKYQDVALLLRRTILKTFRESKTLPWPPTADDLLTSLDNLLPSDLMNFLTLIISGDADIEKCEKTKRLVLSITQV